MLKNMKIGLRLAIGFGAILLFLLGGGLFSMDRMHTLAELTSRLYNHPLLVSNAVLEVNANIIKIHRSMKDMMLAQNAEDIAQTTRDIDGYEALIFERFEVIKTRFLGDKRLYEEAFEAIGAWKPIRDGAIASMKQGNRQEAIAITTGKGAEHAALVEKRMDALIAFAQNKASEFLEGADATRDRTHSVTIVLLCVVVFLGTVIAFLTTRSITNPLKKMTEASIRIAVGDIDQTIVYESQDEIGTLARAFRNLITYIQDIAHAAEGLSKRNLRMRLTARSEQDILSRNFNTAAANLNEGLAQMAGSAREVASAAGQISSGSQSLAQGVSEQASSLEEISSSLEEIASMTKQNAANAQQAKKMSEVVRNSTKKGVESMERLSEAINRIKTSSDETASIVKTIDEIAFQTNLLALNAAVEAARAGEAGQGFAVVAEEVRSLAMRSAEAAKNTSNLIQESVKNAEGGVALNREVLDNLEEIDTQVQKVSEVMVEIAVGSDQQSEGIEQITTAVEQLNVVTQQNASNAESAASAAEELSAQAEEMESLVSSFKLADSDVSEPKVLARPQQRPSRPTGNAKNRNGKSVRVPLTEDPEKIIPFEDEDEAVFKDF